MTIGLKFLFLIAGFLLLIWIFSLLRQDNGDERMKHIAQYAGLGTWSLLIVWAGLKTLLLITNLDLSPVLAREESIGIPALLGTAVTVYVLFFGYYCWKRS